MASASSSSSSSLRQRPAAQQPQLVQDDEQQEKQEGVLPPSNKQPQAAAAAPTPAWSSSSQALLASTANLANLLPTGTLLAFNLLAPAFTNHGACDATTTLLTRGLLAALALSCALASFTDSVRAPADGRVYYGVATPRGLWLIDYPPAAPPPPDTAAYRLAFVDFAHAALSLAVFAAVAARDRNVAACFWGPQPDRETAEMLDILPLGVGVACSLLFVVFPTRRHGIGYPVTAADERSSS